MKTAWMGRGAVLAVMMASGSVWAPPAGAEGVLLEAEGVDLAYMYCTGCHSEMIVAQQGQTREGWDKLFKWMVAEQGMQPIEEPDRSALLDYLEAHYNTDRPNFPRR